MKNILLFRKLSWLLVLCFGLTQLSFGQTYTKITSLADLTDGDYVIVSNSSNNAMNSTLTSGKFGGTGVTVTNNSISSPGTVIVWTITTVSGNVKNIYNASGYVNYTSSTNFSLATGGTTNNARWTASYESGGYFRFNNVGSSGRLITYNGSTFGAYSSGNATNSGTPSTSNVYDVQLYKKVSIPSYTLTYTAGANGSITGTTSQTVQQGSDGSAVTAVPTTGYSFVNWSPGNSTANPRTDTNVQANATYTANFAINTYTVTYNGNGNTSGSAPVDGNSPYNYGSNVTIVGQGSLERTGYSFAGWNTSATGDGTAYAENNVINNIADNVTLYAQWLDDSLLPQTITFNALADVTYGDVDFNLTATASSELSVSYTSSNENVATVSGNIITITGVGETNITASQSGNGEYQPAEPVQQTLTVNQKELSITGITVTTKTYDGNTTASYTGGSLVGVVGSDNVNFTGTVAFVDANAGENKSVTTNFSLTGTNAGNYTLAQPELTGTINKANQTIAGYTNLTKLSTDDAFALATATTIGQTVTYTSTNEDVATIEGTTVTITGVGETTISAEANGTSNYNAFNGTITLTVNFDSALVPEATIADNVSCDRFTAHWNAVTGAESYEVDVYEKSIIAGVAEAFNNHATLSGWTSTNVTVESAGGGYLKMVSSSSSLISPAVDLTSFTTKKLNFRARSFGAVQNNNQKTITVSISVNNGDTWQLLGTRVPSDGTLSDMAEFDLNSYTGTQVKIRVQTLGASGSLGAGVADLILSGNQSIENKIYISGSPFTVVPTEENPTTSLEVTGLTSGTDYYYVVRAKSGSVTSANSNEISQEAKGEQLWFVDADGDGFGAGEAVLACENPSTAEIDYVSNADDCDDFNQNVYPGAPAICYNNIIEDCNGGTIYTGCPVLPVSITSPSCGSILNYRNAPISCNAVSVEGHTVQYRFRIVRSGDNFTASILRDVPNFTILQASYAAYVHPAAATYSVYVSLVVDGEQQPETEVACSISVPAVALPTQGLQNCDTVLTTPSTLVFGPSVSGAVEYQFEISLGGNVVTTLTRPSNYFHSSTNFTEWNYGTTYTVKMKARKSNETFDQLAFGTACNLTYPAIPAQTQALVNCSNTLSTVSTLVFTPSVFGATSYRFELNDGSTTYTVTRPNAYFHFTTDFPEWNYGKTYSVKVQVARNNNEDYGPLSTNACTLTSPAMPTPAQGLVNCATVMTSPNSLLFAPSVFGATNYQFVVTIPGTYYAQFEKNVPYFRLSDVEGWIAGTTYNVTVKAFRNGVESGTSTSCSFTTPGTTPVARIAQVPFAVKAYPNPYSNAFQLDVTSTDKTASIDVKVFDMLGRMVDSKNTTAGDLETATIGSDYPSGVYNVIVTQGEQTKVVRVVKR